MVSPHWYSLKGASVRAGTVLSSWREVTGLVPEMELIKMFNNKSSRMRESGKDSNAITV